ncbi:MAG: mechanosensitive ion channel [Acidobacteria bacterium]|nr:mechanosensitive ion channel [Acidobacteriota bacterium]
MTSQPPSSASGSAPSPSQGGFPGSSTKAFVFAFLVLCLLLFWRFHGPEGWPALVSVIDDNAERLWTYPYFKFGRLSITPAFLTKSFVFLLAMALLSSGARRFFEARFLRRFPLDRGRSYALAQFVGYGVFVMGLMVGVEAAGLDLTTLTVFGGALGLGLGFGLQTVANNFVSGLVLLTDGAIKVGDRIEVGDLVGNVTRIGPRATWIETNGSRVVIVPNSELVSGRVINWTANNPRVRFSLIVGVPYDSDLRKAQSVLVDVARKHPKTLSTPPPEVVCIDFADSSVNLELRVWTIAGVRSATAYVSDLRFSVYEAFRDNGLSFPFPQLDVHLPPAIPSDDEPPAA